MKTVPTLILLVGWLALAISCAKEPNSVSSNAEAKDAETSEILSLQGSEIVLASAAEASALLGAEDSFSTRLTDVDRQLRLNTTASVPLAQYLAFTSSQALSWTEAEKAELRGIVAVMEQAAKSINLHLPPRVVIGKTSGKEEFGAAHTRGNAIFFPAGSFTSDLISSVKLLSHEMWHVISRDNPILRQAMHETTGCKFGSELVLPPALRNRMITNPDAWELRCAFQVTASGTPRWVMPAPLPKPGTTGAIVFSDIGVRLIVVENVAGTWRSATDSSGKPWVLDTMDTNYAELVGINSNYIAHAEEVIADNVGWMLRLKLDLPLRQAENTRIKNREFIKTLETLFGTR